MASSPNRPPLSDFDEVSREAWYDSLAWAWVPAANEASEEPRLARDGETELWTTWDIEQGTIDSEPCGPDSHPGSEESRHAPL